MTSSKRKNTNYDPYAVLGLEFGCTDSEIDKTFKKLALKWHPDKNPNNKEEAQKKFIDIYKAYEFLKDESKRKDFDAELNAKKKRDEYDTQRKAASNERRQYFLEKLRMQEEAVEKKQQKSAPSSTADQSFDAELAKLRKQGAQLLKRVAEENADQERRLFKAQEELRRKDAASAAAAAQHPQSHLYNMSFDDLKALEDEILGS